MTIKTKLSLGLGFLFLIIFALAAFCSNHVGKLAKETDNILKDNYNSLVYSRNMISALEDMKNSIGSTLFNPGDTGMKSDYYQNLFESGRAVFETNLKSENNNITEIHEKETVERLNHDYEMYLKLCLQVKSGAGGSSVYFGDFLPACDKLWQSINAIYDINMQAVVRKSQLVKQDSAGFFTSMAVAATLCVLLALGYFWYFPLYISTSFGYLAERIRNLLKNMGIAFDINTRDEAFVILQAINLLENKLGVKTEDTDSR
jgi:two-component system, NtrC family, sensor histidine kinase KinB